jgi:hypothetical protein
LPVHSLWCCARCASRVGTGAAPSRQSMSQVSAHTRVEARSAIWPAHDRLVTWPASGARGLIRRRGAESPAEIRRQRGGGSATARRNGTFMHRRQEEGGHLKQHHACKPCSLAHSSTLRFSLLVQSSSSLRHRTNSMSKVESSKASSSSALEAPNDTALVAPLVKRLNETFKSGVTKPLAWSVEFAVCGARLSSNATQQKPASAA